MKPLARRVSRSLWAELVEADMLSISLGLRRQRRIKGICHPKAASLGCDAHLSRIATVSDTVGGSYYIQSFS